jgi:hypothetical protein
MNSEHLCYTLEGDELKHIKITLDVRIVFRRNCFSFFRMENSLGYFCPIKYGKPLLIVS